MVFVLLDVPSLIPPVTRLPLADTHEGFLFSHHQKLVSHTGKPAVKRDRSEVTENVTPFFCVAPCTVLAVSITSKSILASCLLYLTFLVSVKPCQQDQALMWLPLRTPPDQNQVRRQPNVRHDNFVAEV